VFKRLAARTKRLTARAGVYFGVRDYDDEYAPAPSTRVILLRGWFEDSLALASWMAVVGAAAVVGLFGRDPGSLALATLLGAVVGGITGYVGDVHPSLPRGTLPPVPSDATWEPGTTRPLRSWLSAAVCVVLLAWVVGLWDGMDFFIPGWFLGMVAASSVGIWRVRRWERRHGCRAAFRLDAGEEVRYAVPNGFVVQRTAKPSQPAGSASLT
jgi:hypothetical protein